jgi:hypothetical protein
MMFGPDGRPARRARIAAERGDVARLLDVFDEAWPELRASLGRARDMVAQRRGRG